MTARGRAPLVVVGDTLLDRDLAGSVERLAPDAPVPVIEDIETVARPGGAGLAAVLAARDGREVTLVTALGDDEAGDEVRSLLADAGVRLVDVGLAGATPEKVRVRGGGVPVARLDYGGRSGTLGAVTAEARAAIAGAGALLVSCYGRGITADPAVRDVVASLPQRVPVVWDPHPRGAAPVPGARLVTPNRVEAGVGPDDTLATVTARARALGASWSAAGVCVTLGARGALLVEGDGMPLAVPPPIVAGGDPCGAGDRFASAAAGFLADGALPSEAVTAAVHAAASFVARGGATTISFGAAVDLRDEPSAGDDVDVLLATVRGQGGTVVATGGCFDLLHAGHVRSLQAARALGDCLVVCLNSDVSVRRLKGPGRPLQPQQDRADVLLGLGCVDAVVTFDEDTPVEILRRIRPDVWAKGGDYSAATLPEAALVESWGGQAVILPFLEGRSTTRLVTIAKESAVHVRP